MDRITDTQQFKDALDRHITGNFGEDQYDKMLSCTCEDGTCEVCIEYYEEEYEN